MKELSFPQALKQLIGFEAKLYLTSTRIVNGVLLDVKEDHIIVQREDKIFYFSFNQIHAIVKNAKNISPKTSFLPHESKRHLLDVLIEFKYSWITIESVNNQLFMGLLTKITEDYVMLLNEDDQIYIQRSFIVGIYNGVYEEEKIEETKEESNSNQTDNNSTIENENHTEERIQEQKDAEKEETEVLSIVNTPSSATKTPEEEIQIIDTLEHREVQSLPLTTNPSNINQVSEEAIIHVEGNAKQEESELSALVEIDNIHEKETETQAITPFNDNSSLSNNNDTSLPNSSPSSHDSTSSITTGSSETNNFTNSLKSSISDLRKLFPFSYNNQSTDTDSHDHKKPNRVSNPILTEPSPVNDFILPSSIEKDPLEDTEANNFAVIPKLDTSTDYLSHPLNGLGYFNNPKKKEPKKEKKSIPAKKKPVNPSPVKKNLDPIEQNYLLEKQYYSLMKHAEFMYNKLRNERLKNKIQD